MAEAPNPTTQSSLRERLNRLLSPREREAAPADDAELIPWVAQRTLIPAALLEQARHSERLRLGDYTIVGRLGRGGMGAVLKAQGPQGVVALKLLQGDAAPMLRARFEREADALSRLQHPHVVGLRAFERVGGLAYLVLEYVPGQTLERRLKAGPLAEPDAFRLLAQSAAALECAEQAGVIHRDLKPANILWIESSDTYKLLDFGIARFRDSSFQQLTASGTTLGTPAYMSPEQAQGKDLDARSDMYSLALTLHEALTQQVPFESKIVGEMLTRRVDQDVPSVRSVRASVGEPLSELIAWLSQREREARPRTWSAFRQRLAAVAAELGVELAVDEGAPAPSTRVEEFDPSPTDGVVVAVGGDTPGGALELPGTDEADDPPSSFGALTTLREPAIGETLGDYELNAVLGRGGMGVVYRATHRGSGQTCALKAVVVGQGPEGERRRERFEREVLALRRLAHPNIVRVHAYGRKDPYDWYAMDLIEGRPLDEILADPDAKLTRHQKLTIFVNVCKAVAHAHEHSVLHRDLKPSNVLVDGNTTPYVLDFGLAKITDETKQGLTRTGAFMGTPYYMAPEQFLDPKGADARIDVFSLGVMLYEMMVGQRPFQGDTAGEVSFKIMREKPTRPSKANPKLEKAFDAVLKKALQKKPDHRYRSVDKLKRDVVRLRRGTAEAETILQRAWGFSSRWLGENRAGVFVGALLATVAYIPVVLLLYWLLESV